MKYTHVETGETDTRENWIESYDPEELSARGLTAEQAFAEDEGVTLLPANTFTMRFSWGRYPGLDQLVEVEALDEDDAYRIAYGMDCTFQDNHGHDFQPGFPEFVTIEAIK